MLALLAAWWTHGSASTSATDVLPSDDAYHYGAWADGQNDAFYTEWWYFNFSDPGRNLEGIFSYFIIDPANATGLGRAQIAAVAYTPQGRVSAIDVYQPGAFSASDQAANVRIEGNTVEALSASAYRIEGATRDGRMSWDLTYTKKASAWLAADRMPVGNFAWEQMSWLVYMPSASVSGRLTVDGQAYSIHSTGYHDHNWGEWIFTNALWNWAQCSRPGLSIELGDFAGKPAGILGLDFDGRRTVFGKDQYFLVHTAWAFDAANFLLYPAESLIFAQNDDTLLWLVLHADETQPLRGDLPFPLPDPVIYEQTARCTGQVWRRGSQGEWTQAAQINIAGFKEYTANAWP